MKRWVDGKEIYFYNLENKSEELIFNDVLVWMRKHKSIRFEEKIKGPYYDCIRGDCDGILFTLVCDLEDGVDIICESEKDACSLNEKLEYI